MVRAILIHLVVPLAGLGLFLILRRRMLNAHIEEPPVILFFILFATYGALLVLILTALFWLWSGMATLGLAYLILVAPLLTLGLAVVLYRRRRISGYHTAAFWMSVGYVPCLLFLYAARTGYYGLPW
jgi:hypothetical protein